MCFTVNVNLIKEELENRFDATLIDRDRYRPSYYYHAFALPELPAVCSSDPSVIRLLRWGLIPSWTRSADDAQEIRYKTFNARSEGIDKKRSFSMSVKFRRCIIPVRGFYEWQHAGKEKVPWYIFNADGGIMSIAGLFDEWTDNSTGESLSTFSVVTTDANELMAEIHNSARRMPVILDINSGKKWIDKNLSAEDVLNLLQPCPSDILKAHTISPLISSRTDEKNTPDIIKPYTYFKNNTLF
jgi:putative SOS response-associated peptidase YedK